MSRENDYLQIKLEIDENDEITLKVDTYLPSKSTDLFMSFTALAYGITAVLEDSQEELAELGLAYMSENGITLAGILSASAGKARMN
jgi:hypothetical protein